MLGLASSPDGRWLAAHTDKGHVIIFCLHSGKRVRTLHGGAGDDFSRPIQAWHPSGRYIYASANDTPGLIVVWELASERQVSFSCRVRWLRYERRSHHHCDAPHLVSPIISPRIPTSDSFASVIQVATLRGHTGLVRDLHSVVDGGRHLLISCGYDKTLRIWAAGVDAAVEVDAVEAMEGMHLA